MSTETVMNETLREKASWRWWRIRAWFRRCPECGQRGYGGSSPRWESDPIAQVLGIARYGCPCCGSGAVEARNADPNYTCPTACVEQNHPGREHDDWLPASSEREGQR